MKKIEVRIPCHECKKLAVFQVPEKSFIEWQQGKLVQDAFPQLSDDERELLLSGLCPSCYAKTEPMEEHETPESDYDEETEETWIDESGEPTENRNPKKFGTMPGSQRVRDYIVNYFRQHPGATIPDFERDTKLHFAYPYNMAKNGFLRMIDRGDFMEDQYFAPEHDSRKNPGATLDSIYQDSVRVTEDKFKKPYAKFGDREHKFLDDLYRKTSGEGASEEEEWIDLPEVSREVTISRDLAPPAKTAAEMVAKRSKELGLDEDTEITEGRVDVSSDFRDITQANPGSKAVDYKWFVVDRNGKALSGWEFKQDALDASKDEAVPCAVRYVNQLKREELAAFLKRNDLRLKSNPYANNPRLRAASNDYYYVYQNKRDPDDVREFSSPPGANPEHFIDELEDGSKVHYDLIRIEDQNGDPTWRRNPSTKKPKRGRKAIYKKGIYKVTAHPAEDVNGEKYTQYRVHYPDSDDYIATNSLEKAKEEADWLFAEGLAVKKKSVHNPEDGDDVSSAVYSHHKNKPWAKNFRELWTRDQIRIILRPDQHADMDDLKGDTYDPNVNSDIPAEKLAEEEKEFERKVDREGVWVAAAEFKNLDGGWENMDSIGGLVGGDFIGSGYDEEMAEALVEKMFQPEWKASVERLKKHRLYKENPIVWTKNALDKYFGQVAAFFTIEFIASVRDGHPMEVLNSMAARRADADRAGAAAMAGLLPLPIRDRDDIVRRYSDEFPKFMTWLPAPHTFAEFRSFYECFRQIDMKALKKDLHEGEFNRTHLSFIKCVEEKWKRDIRRNPIGPNARGIDRYVKSKHDKVLKDRAIKSTQRKFKKRKEKFGEREWRYATAALLIMQGAKKRLTKQK